MDKLTNVDWIWEQQFPIEKLTEEEMKSLEQMIDEIWRIELLKNIEDLDDMPDLYEDGG